MAVSACTYLSFENPIRHAKVMAMPRAALALWPATVATVLVLANVAISAEPALAVTAPQHAAIVSQPLNSYLRRVAQSVTPARLAEPIPTVLYPAAAQVYHDGEAVRGCSRRDRAWGKCVLGDRRASRSFAVFGDSHANAWLSAFDYFATHHHYRLIVLTHQACTVGVAVTLCRVWWASSLSQLSRDHPQFLVVAQRFDTRVPSQQMYLGLRQELKAFDERVPRTVVMEDPPYHPLINPTDCLLRNGATLGDCALAFPADLGAQDATVREIVQSHAKDRFLHTRQWFCSGGTCPMVVGNMIVFRDTHHISDTYARHLAPAVSHSLCELTKACRGLR